MRRNPLIIIGGECIARNPSGTAMANSPVISCDALTSDYNQGVSSQVYPVESIYTVKTDLNVCTQTLTDVTRQTCQDKDTFWDPEGHFHSREETITRTFEETYFQLTTDTDKMLVPHFQTPLTCLNSRDYACVHIAGRCGSESDNAYQLCDNSLECCTVLNDCPDSKKCQKFQEQLIDLGPVTDNLLSDQFLFEKCYRGRESTSH